MICPDNVTASCPKPESVYQTMEQLHKREERGGNPGRGSYSPAPNARKAVEETS